MVDVVLAATSNDQGILATDLESGASVTTFEECHVQPHGFGTIGGSTGFVYALQAHKAMWEAWVWGTKKPTYRASLPEKMTAMAFTSSGGLCFGGSEKGTIYVWQLGT
eukprot:2031326-Amphidinium_carterae.1